MRLDLSNKIRAYLGSPEARKNLMALLTAVFFASLLTAYRQFLPVISRHLEHPEFVAMGILVLTSVVIMVFWLTLGVFGGLGAFLLALIFLHRQLMALNPHYYTVLISTFFLSSGIGYYYYRKICVARQEHDLSLEKLGEDINLISNHLKKRNSEVTAMGEKIVNLLKLKNISDSLSLSLSEKEVIKIIAEESLILMGGRCRVSVFLNDRTRKRFFLSRVAKHQGRKDFPKEVGGVLVKWVSQDMKSLLIKDIRKDFRFSLGEEDLSDDAVSVIMKPLIFENQILGILRLDSDKDNAFGQNQQRLLDIIGGLASVALENARLYRKTESLAIKDSLTGLYVHRYFMERLGEEIKRALHSKNTFALLMIDIDEFKEFNDKYGHMTGDAVLRNVGSILKKRLSPGDLVARYGGEEFVFLALNVSREQALDLAENLRKQIEASLIEMRREKLGVTVSVGVGLFPEDGHDKEGIIKIADKYLYKAKKEGKNKVCSK